ncbi:MAG: 1-deoxy-D-xylulose-5-phosphate reductoisomerase [Candidatus Zixiibacteriota bacterium]
MMTRSIAILGSTGSIGRSTVEVAKKHPGCFRVRALAAHSNIELLALQCREFRPQYVGIVDPSAAGGLRSLLADQEIEIVVGADEVVRLAGVDDVDMVVNAIVGAAGLRASVETVRAGKLLALANKESLVAGGPLFADMIKKSSGAKILPIDSEHSAIWQVLNCGRRNEIRQLIITASGGPFRTLPLEQFTEITAEQALNHPTWKMGPKITVDSATLVNKGLEVIEATALFSFSADQITVVVHPQSIIHSAVEFVDSSIIAQMSRPDMRLPITYALFWPERVESDFGCLDLTRCADLTFEAPDFERFPALKLAFEVAKTGGTAPAVFNAANEVAVAAFLKNSVLFTSISDIIARTVETVSVVSKPSLEDVLGVDGEARRVAESMIGKTTCC